MNIDMSKTTEGNTYCCMFCICVEDNKHIFKKKVLINRIHKCKIVDILTETQYIEMYERIKINQIEAYNKYMEKHKYDIGFKNKRKQSKRKSYHKCKNRNKLHQETVSYLYINYLHKNFFVFLY